MAHKIDILYDFTSLKDQPDVRWEGRNSAVLMKDWYIALDIDEERHHINIRKGYRSDGSSISSLSGIFGIPADGRNRAAWLLHDYLCDKDLFTPSIRNRVFYLMLVELKMGKARSWLAYTAVRLFWRLWK